MNDNELIKCSDKASDILALMGNPWLGDEPFRLILTGGKAIVQRRSDNKCHVSGAIPHWR